MSGFPSWATIGAKVVLVKPYTYINPAYMGDVPQTRVIYEIRGTTIHDELGLVGISLVGVNSASQKGGPFWPIQNFRPLVHDANDAEVEREIYRRKVHQNGAPVKELEPAE